MVRQRTVKFLTMYKQSTPSLNAICAVNPSYTPGHVMNFSGSASMLLNFSTGVILLLPLLVATEPMIFVFKSPTFRPLLPNLGQLRAYMISDASPTHFGAKKVYRYPRSTRRCEAVNAGAGTQSQMMQNYLRRCNRLERRGYGRRLNSRNPTAPLYTQPKLTLPLLRSTNVCLPRYAEKRNLISGKSSRSIPTLSTPVVHVLNSG